MATLQKTMRLVAEQNGAAFWDYRAAMGGEGSMRTFLQKKLAWTDAIHLSNKGHELMGDRLMHALFDDNARFRREHPDAVCR